MRSKNIWHWVWLLGTAGAMVCPGLRAESLSGTQNSWVSTERAYQTGDLISVLISENAQAQQSASTELHKDASLGYTSGGFLANLAPAANVGLNSKHDGGGNLARQGKMQAMVTASVQEVLPNGMLRIKGEQQLVFDSGSQLIKVEGLVRPRDVSSQNEVYSYRIANAKIEYHGEGALAEKARTGFLTRVLEWLWIF